MFEPLDNKALSQLANRAVYKHYVKGQCISLEGDIFRSYDIIVSGKIKVFKQTPFGRLVTITILHAGQTFGDMALFDGKPLSVSALALEDVTVVCIDRVHFLDVVEQYPSMMTAILINIASRYKEAQERIIDLAAYDIRRRIPRVLCELFLTHGSHLPLTHQEIADIAGTNRENASRILEHLRFIGAIEATRGKLKLRNVTKLRNSSL